MPHHKAEFPRGHNSLRVLKPTGERDSLGRKLYHYVNNPKLTEHEKKVLRERRDEFINKKKGHGTRHVKGIKHLFK